MANSDAPSYPFELHIPIVGLFIEAVRVNFFLDGLLHTYLQLGGRALVINTRGRLDILTTFWLWDASEGCRKCCRGSCSLVRLHTTWKAERLTENASEPFLGVSLSRNVTGKPVSASDGPFVERPLRSCCRVFRLYR